MLGLYVRNESGEVVQLGTLLNVEHRGAADPYAIQPLSRRFDHRAGRTARQLGPALAIMEAWRTNICRGVGFEWTATSYQESASDARR